MTQTAEADAQRVGDRRCAMKPDTMKEERELSNPTDLGEFWIWKEQYVVIKEA